MIVVVVYCFFLVKIRLFMKRSLIVVLFLLGCSLVEGEVYRGEVMEEGLIECFDGRVERGGKRSNISSTSASVLARTKGGREIIYFANDKEMTGVDKDGKLLSPVFSMDYERGLSIRGHSISHVTETWFLYTKKIESMAVVRREGEDDMVIMSTGFSSVMKEERKLPIFPAYNVILYFPAGKPEMVKIANQTYLDGLPTSFSLRTQIGKALKTEAFVNGVPYLNFEGLVALPNGQLLLGIRQMGRHYSDFSYKALIVAGSYIIDKNGDLKIRDDFEKIYEFDPKEEGRISEDMGISDLAYDHFNDRLYILTAFELTDDGGKGDLGAYLWVLPVKDLYNNVRPKVVLNGEGEPMVFEHKFEGIAVLGRDRVLLVADDDYVFWDDRKHNETPYVVLKITSNE